MNRRGFKAGHARFLRFYDIRSDTMVARLDVLSPDGSYQWSVDVEYPADLTEVNDHIIAPAMHTLRAHVEAEGYRFEDCVAPEIPRDAQGHYMSLTGDEVGEWQHV